MTTAKVARKKRVITASLVIVSFALLAWPTAQLAPYAVFDVSKTAYDWQSEQRDGKTTAWGPRPRRWLIFADSDRSTYFGSEWYFRVFRGFCREWLDEKGYIEPEAQVGGW